MAKYPYRPWKAAGYIRSKVQVIRRPARRHPGKRAHRRLGRTAHDVSQAASRRLARRLCGPASSRSPLDRRSGRAARHHQAENNQEAKSDGEARRDPVDREERHRSQRLLDTCRVVDSHTPTRWANARMAPENGSQTSEGRRVSLHDAPVFAGGFDILTAQLRETDPGSADRRGSRSRSSWAPSG